MTTITTVQLRKNLSDVVARLGRGETIRLTYRRKPVGEITPVKVSKKTPARGSSDAVMAAISRLRFDDITESVKNKSRPIKELIHEMRDNDLR